MPMNPHELESIHSSVASYYAEKLQQHGDTPRGVDWNGEQGQVLRFAQLLRVVDLPGAYSINDLGCGYGALVEYLQSAGGSVTYHGYDVSQEMILAARSRHAGAPNADFHVAAAPTQVADYGVASGIFNVRLGHTDSGWMEYIRSTLEVMNRTSRRGFAFNCLTSYSDADRMQDYLFYADPCALFDLCKRSYSRNVSLLHDYDLYEFTILVKKAP
jgi:SAM-dependent methyltransferase